MLNGETDKTKLCKLNKTRVSAEFVNQFEVIRIGLIDEGVKLFLVHMREEFVILVHRSFFMRVIEEQPKEYEAAQPRCPPRFALEVLLAD